MKDLAQVDITVCIVNWNTTQLLHNCLNSIYSNPWRASLQVIVVDNHSDDDSVAMVKRDFPDVQLIANVDNVGFSKANNQAFKLASGRYILMLNSDTLVQPGAFDTMMDFMDQHLEAGAMGCKLLNADGTLQRSCWRGFPSLRMAAVDAFYLWKWASNWSWVRGVEISKEELQQTIQVDHLLGACILARRETVEQIGGMDESVFLFFEETEWCHRMRQCGWKIYYSPTAEIIHLGQQSANLNPERNLPEKYHNYEWFFQKCMEPSLLQQGVLRAVFVTAGVIRIGLWEWRGRNPVRREFAKRMIAGYRKVVKQSVGLSHPASPTSKPPSNPSTANATQPPVTGSSAYSDSKSNNKDIHVNQAQLPSL